MLECFLCIGCKNAMSQINQTLLNATKTESLLTDYRNVPIDELD